MQFKFRKTHNLFNICLTVSLLIIFYNILVFAAECGPDNPQPVDIYFVDLMVEIFDPDENQISTQSISLAQYVTSGLPALVYKPPEKIWLDKSVSWAAEANTRETVLSGLPFGIYSSFGWSYRDKGDKDPLPSWKDLIEDKTKLGNYVSFSNVWNASAHLPGVSGTSVKKNSYSKGFVTKIATALDGLTGNAHPPGGATGRWLFNMHQVRKKSGSFFEPTFGNPWGCDINGFINRYGTSNWYGDTSVTPDRIRKDLTDGHFLYRVNGKTKSKSWGEFEYHSPGEGAPESAPGAAVFLDSCNAYGEDYNADARFDQLVIESELEITEAGQMFISASVSSSGSCITNRSDSNAVMPLSVSIDAVPGTMPVQVGLSGEDIANSGLDGPYTINLMIINAAGEVLDTLTCETPQIFANQFGESPAVIVASSDQGVDDDDDTLFNRLLAQIEMTIFTQGDYMVSASLLGSTGQEIAFASTKEAFGTGSSVVDLYFSGEDINRSGESGPYQLEVSLLDATGTQVDSTVFTTSSYHYNEFDSKSTIISDSYDDFGTDTNNNGRYEYLTIEADISVEQAQTCNISCWLQDGEGKDIAHVETEKTLIPGSQKVSLNFDGEKIYQHGADGPYTIIYIMVKDSQDVIRDAVRNVYQTAAYQSTEFEAPPETFSKPYRKL